MDALNQIFHHATFERARQGDLVIVPPKSFTSDALVGEFVDGPFKSVNVKVDRLYLDDSLPGRRVKWLASIPKRKLPIRVIEAIQKPSAFSCWQDRFDRKYISRHTLVLFSEISYIHQDLM